MVNVVSIIIPVYNTEKYLRECLESICIQTYSKFEVILINDGSSDNSGKICQEFAKKDKRFIVLEQNNKGVSSARNRGLDMAQGQYVLFIDSDDFVEKNYVEDLYMKMLNYDIAVCGIGRFIGGEKKEDLLNEQELDKISLISQTLGNKYVGGYLVNKIFKKDIIDKYHLRFNEKVHIGEDMLWILEYLNFCNSGIYISKTLYYYRLNEKSALQSSMRSGEFDKKNLEVLFVDDMLRNAVLCEEKQVKTALAYRYIRSDMRVLFNMIKCHYSDANAFSIITEHTRKHICSFFKSTTPTRLEKCVSAGMYISAKAVYQIGIIGDLFLGKYFERYLQ